MGISGLLDLEERFGIEFDIINANDNFEVAKAYGIHTVPAVVVEEDGKFMARYTTDDPFNPHGLVKFLEVMVDVGN